MNFATSQHVGEVCCAFAPQVVCFDVDLEVNVLHYYVRRLTKEGETIPLCQYPLDLETDTCKLNSSSFVFLVWPATVVHRINRSSPLWDISAEQMLTERFEIIVILEGKQKILYHLSYKNHQKTILTPLVGRF